MSEFTTVATFTDVNQAMLAQIHLSELGIQAFVVDAELANMDWFYRNAIGYIKIQTPVEQAEAARAMLEAWGSEQRAGQEVTGEHVEDRENCLACGAPLPDDAASCPACGWSYASAKTKSARVPPADDVASPLASEPATDGIVDDDAIDDPDAIEQPETNDSNLGLLIGLIIAGLFAFGMLPRLREYVQTRF